MINCKKLLAMFLIFTLTFSNFAFASNGFISLFGNSSADDNVEFSAYLTNGDETSTQLVSDVNNENLSIKMQLDVKDSGYLKDGEVKIVAEDGEELNFKIKTESEEETEIENLSDKIQSLEDNVIKLRKIESSSEEVEILLPIEYNQEKYITESKLLEKSKVILSGVYVDKDGDENEISSEVELTLAWEDEREVRVDNDVTKYVKFSDDGIILQTMVKVDSSTEENSLPIKSTELNIDVPTINDVAPTEIAVVANTTEGTNGKTVGEVEFSNDNWLYDEIEKKITINVTNEKELVEINETEEYLKEDKEVKEEERYFSGSGTDEYLVTYVYRNAELTDEINVTLKANANVTMFSGIEEDGITVSSENEKEFTLTTQTGNIVSYDIQNKSESVSKVYGYLGQEAEFESTTSINVSLTDLVEEIMIEDVENYYIDKENNPLTTDDIYYKEISVSKENFEEMLGDEGKIEILDQDGIVLSTIDKNMEADENGNYVVSFEERISKVTIKTSAPVKTGNLIISNKKAMSNVSVDKNTYANILEIATDTVQRAKLEYVSELTQLDTNTCKTVLDDTKTNFNLIMDRNSLSTVTTNSDVEMRLEFNNDEEKSDIYGDSIFEIEMPAYITKVEITNASMVNGEGLELSNVETYEKDGKTIIKMSVSGTQTALNSGVLTNGTNIVLNMNIDVDKYTPAKDDVITTYGYNSEATNYTDAAEYTINDETTCGLSELDISYSGPTGVVAINSLSNYESEGKVLTSVKEGSKTDYLEIYEEAKNAKSEIVVINNNDNEVSNIAILGRLPYKGVKDIDSDNELGTTITTPLASLITASETNNGEFTVYYSDKEDATKELDNEENNWVTEPESLENVKSYLIVPNSSDYEMGAKEVLRFSYDYTIPANLEHNEKIYGTFLVYYENKGMEEAARPDLVGLSTGVGPELDLEVSSDKDQVKELDEFTITAKVTNSGEDLANNVKLAIPVPAGTTYVSSKSDRDSAEIKYENGEVVASMVRLEKNVSVELNVTVKVNTVENYDMDQIKISAKAVAENLRKEKTATGEAVQLLTSQLTLKQYVSPFQNPMYEKDNKMYVDFVVENKVNSKMKNVTVEAKLPKELSFVQVCTNEENVTYDASTNTVIWNIASIDAKETLKTKVELQVGELDEGVLSKTCTIISKMHSDGMDTYNAKDIEINIGKASLSIAQTSTTATYVDEGYAIDYKFTIKNEGSILASGVQLADVIPDGLRVREISYVVDDATVSSQMSQTDSAYAVVSVPANSEVNVDVKATASSLEGIKEKTVTNDGYITDSNGNIIKSNSVTHIVKANESQTEETTSSSDIIRGNSNDNNSTDITKSYKITGTAWLDANKNGMRDSGETRMNNITAMLVESNSGVIKSTTSTNSNGEYTFAGLANGSYIVIFKYDTRLYTTTSYKKEGVDTSVNSDVVTTKIEQDGKKENAAVTDTITVNGSNVSGIDIGLVDATKFSLALDKSITKVTVQNEQGTKTENYNKAKLAKYEIRAKYLTGSTVYVEYTYTVTNNGDFAGYASEIVDYIPEGMTFNSNLNKDWYTGTDGNLYTKALENSELNVGESKEITLVFTKQMTEENTGIVSNTAEIASDYNIYGVSDDNSTPANKAQNEDDMSTADLIISVGTGEALIYISAIIVSIILASAIGIIVYKRLLENKSKGGV